MRPAQALKPSRRFAMPSLSYRIINTPSGNILLVGVGGSGKQSLTKLASFICTKEFFQISLTKSYGDQHLKDDIKELYRKAGPMGKSVSFIMTDAEIKSETFLEAINSMLATGEIPGLIPKDEKDVISLECKAVFLKEIGGVKGVDPSNLELWTFFINRVKDQLHMILAFSPVGNKFRERSQKFPSLFSQCSIDWFLPWPEDALVAVSSKFLGSFKMDTKKEIKKELELHMGKVHDLVTEVCDIYFQRMRRYVYVTPKSYLSFIDLYKDVYTKKYNGIDVEEANIVKGLDRLAEASEGVELLKIALKKEEITLKEATDEVEKVLKELEVENRKAKEKSDEVAIVQAACIAQKTQIMGEKEAADRDLAKALPFLEKAVAAADSIKPADINELKGMRNAVDTTRLIMDTIHVLFQRSLNPCKPRALNILKTDIPFINDSFDDHTKNTLSNSNFLKELLEFSANEKDNINEETIELLEPYLLLQTPDGREIYNGAVAKKSSSALEGLCTWTAAMSDYHKASKIVKPKLLLLNIK
jgi:dynein heavy chain, axonemal